MRYLFIFTCGLLLFGSNVLAQVDFEINGSLCVNNRLVFTDNSSLTATAWEWIIDSDTITTADSAVYTFNSPGAYNVQLTLTTTSGDFPYSRTIEIHENPDCDFIVDTVFWSSFTRIFTDNSTSLNTITTYLWDFGDGGGFSMDTSVAEYKYSAEGDYVVKLEITDENGCIDSLSQVVSVDDIYIVPNVFTPNGDNKNDDFIVTVNGVDRFSIDIYSRWGNLVFNREGVNQIVWDGRLPDGSKVTPGTYYYVITASDSQKTYKPEAGFVMVFYGKNSNE